MGLEINFTFCAVGIAGFSNNTVTPHDPAAGEFTAAAEAAGLHATNTSQHPAFRSATTGAVTATTPATTATTTVPAIQPPPAPTSPVTALTGTAPTPSNHATGW